MLAILKIIHFLCLFGGGAAGIGNGMLMRRVMEGDGPPPPMVVRTMRTLGRVGFVSVLLLWITGILMVLLSGGLAAAGAMFWIKLLGAAVVLVVVSTMTYLAITAEKAGTPPPLPRMKALSHYSYAGVLIAVVFAVLAFN